MGKPLESVFRNNLLKFALAGAIFTAVPSFTGGCIPSYIASQPSKENYRYHSDKGFLEGAYTNIDIRNLEKVLEWPKRINSQSPLTDEGLGRPVSFYEAGSVINRINEEGYLGKKDWRIPTKDEWKSILSKEMVFPSLIYSYLWEGENLGRNYWSSENCQKSKDGKIVCRLPTFETERLVSLFNGSFNNVNPNNPNLVGLVFPVRKVDGDELVDLIFSIK